MNNAAFPSVIACKEGFSLVHPSCNGWSFEMMAWKMLLILSRKDGKDVAIVYLSEFSAIILFLREGNFFPVSKRTKSLCHNFDEGACENNLVTVDRGYGGCPERMLWRHSFFTA